MIFETKAKVNLDKYHQAVLDYSKLPNPQQRLGQYLMNTLIPEQVDPKLFYEKDWDRASQLFLDNYVSQG